MPRRSRRFLAVLTSLAAAGAVATPAAQAVVHGSDDAGAHPMVGHMVAQTDDGEALWRCTGTLVDERTFVTAGHCTSDDGGGASSVDFVALWFGDGPYEPTTEFLADVRAGEDPPCLDDEGVRRAGYPCTGERTGEAYTHPDFDPAQFELRDLGVVKLDTPYVLPADQYGTLPEVGAYDSWTSSTKQDFTSVGYGAQKVHGQGAAWKNESVTKRMVARPRLNSVNKKSTGDHSMLLSNNASTGGTCVGDSGGPNFLGDGLEIAGITSSGTSPTCGGQGGVYRLDRDEDRPWLRCVIAAPDEATARACTTTG